MLSMITPAVSLPPIEIGVMPLAFSASQSAMNSSQVVGILRLLSAKIFLLYVRPE